jgi:uncharacterized protein YecE (DUF72 family)
MDAGSSFASARARTTAGEAPRSREPHASSRPRIGTAGWSIPAACRDALPGEGSHLERYAQRFDAVEINSSFYRPHRRATYERWADTVGPEFRFAVKMPKSVSHAQDWAATGPEIDQFAEEVAGLGYRLGVALIQFPPSRSFARAAAEALFSRVAQSLACPLVCEPRHRSWFEDDVDALLAWLGVARVGADPAIVPRAAEVAGWPALRYRRLHGSPKIYYSDYGAAALEKVRRALAEDVAAGAESWCIFDNTASGAATGNALELLADVAAGQAAP